VVVKEVPAGATVVGIPGRIVEEKGAEKERFAAYAVVQEQDDPYAKVIQQLVEHSQELERELATLRERLARLEKDAQQEQQLRAVK
jgi:serine O-acetyltransferase